MDVRGGREAEGREGCESCQSCIRVTGEQMMSTLCVMKSGFNKWNAQPVS